MKARVYHYLKTILLSAALSAAVQLIGLQWSNSLTWGVEILSSSITLGAILCGFDSVHKNTLLTVESTLMKSIRSTGYISDVLASMRDFTFAAIIFVIISLSYILFFCNQAAPLSNANNEGKTLIYSHPYALFAWLFAFFYMILIFLYVHQLFNNIIKVSSQEN